ncbi:MAG: hypothetical protein RLZZ385_952 [Pseudomonadota bacterium]|jgi:8-oxo-dGTP pyrophosphatase MutT (NUDIX family)
MIPGVRFPHPDPDLTRLLDYFQHREPGAPLDIPHPDANVQADIESRRKHLREASVLIPITAPTAGTPSQVILTVRAADLPRHPGQISLPGGTRDAGDPDRIATALRESEEEIGLPADQVQVIGELGEILLPSGYRVVPVIGLLQSLPVLRPCPVEVQEIFMAPLGLLLDPDAYREVDLEYGGQTRKVLELHHRHYRIWGATAVILHHLARQLRTV